MSGDQQVVMTDRQSSLKVEIPPSIRPSHRIQLLQAPSEHHRSCCVVFKSRNEYSCDTPGSKPPQLVTPFAKRVLPRFRHDDQRDSQRTSDHPKPVRDLLVMACEHPPALTFRQSAAHTGCQSGSLDEPGDLLVVEPVGGDCLALAGNAPEQAAMGDAENSSQISSATTGQGAAASRTYRRGVYWTSSPHRRSHAHAPQAHPDEPSRGGGLRPDCQVAPSP